MNSAIIDFLRGIGFGSSKAAVDQRQANDTLILNKG